MGKTGTELGNEMLNKPLTPQTYDEFITQLGRHPTDEEYRGWIKPRISDRVKEYRNQNMDDTLALAELDDEFGYDDLVREAWYGRPKRTDAQIFRDRVKGMSMFDNITDEEIADFIKRYGPLERRGEW